MALQAEDLISDTVYAPGKIIWFLLGYFIMNSALIKQKKIYL